MSTAPELTPRQRKALELVADGHTDAEIGAALYLSPSGAKKEVAELRVRLGAKNRAHAVAIAYRAGILPAATNGATP